MAFLRWGLRLGVLLLVLFPALINFSMGTTTAVDSQHSLDDGSAYRNALATIRCFVTPNCFPHRRCRFGVPSKIPTQTAEEKEFCQDSLHAEKNASGACLIYSIGIFNSWLWEEKAAQEFGCQVYALDPTVDHPKDLAPGVTFFKLGLQATGTDLGRFHAQQYKQKEASKLLTLPQMRERLGTGDQPLDLLHMDCEGCEWGVLESLFCGLPGQSGVKQLLLELHFSKDLGLNSKEDVLRAARAIECLERDRWHITAAARKGASPSSASFLPGLLAFLTTPTFLMMVSLERAPEEDPLDEEIRTLWADALKRPGDEKAGLNNGPTRPDGYWWKQRMRAMALRKKFSNRIEHFTPSGF